MKQASPSKPLRVSLGILIAGITPAIIWALYVHHREPALEWPSYLAAAGAPCALWGVVFTVAVTSWNAWDRKRFDLGLVEGKRHEEIDKERRLNKSAALNEFAESSAELFDFIHILGQGNPSEKDFAPLLDRAVSATKHYPELNDQDFERAWDEFIGTAGIVHSKLKKVKGSWWSKPNRKQMHAVYGKEELGIKFNELKIDIEQRVKSLRHNSS